MNLGFSYEENMVGTVRFVDEPLVDRETRLQLRICSAGFTRLTRDRTVNLAGIIDIEGVADHQPIEGTVAYKLEERRVPYSFSFRAEDGRTMFFRAQKDFAIYRAAEFFTRLDGTIYNEQMKELARVQLRTKLVDGTIDLLKSIRLQGSFL